MSHVQILSKKDVLARKNHRCDYCGLPIETGSLYERTGLIYDDGPYTWKSHKHCEDFAHDFNFYDDIDDEGLSGDSFRTGVWELYRFIMREKFNEIYESKEFKYPTIKEAMDFVIQYKNIVK